jgi:hypothetical protein
MIEIDAKTGHELAALARKLKQVGDGRVVPREFRKALRKAGLPALAAGKNAARSLPSRNTGKSDLRRNMARAMVMRISVTGEPQMKIGVAKKTLGTQRNLPKLTNQGTWRHPVFGRDVWVVQSSVPGWFDDVMRAQASNVTREIENVMKDFERRIK